MNSKITDLEPVGGSTNHDTHELLSIIDNDEAVYEDKIAWLKRVKRRAEKIHKTPTLTQSSCIIFFNKWKTCLDLSGVTLYQVDWGNVRDTWQSELDELD